VIDLGAHLDALCRRNRLLLPRVAGNFAIHIPGGSTWVVVTQGRSPGVRTELGDEVIDFAISCEADVLTALFGGGDVDLSREVAEGRVAVAGDPAVLVRFLELAERRSLLDVRSGT